MDGIEEFAVFGRYWQPAPAHVDIHSQYVGDCGATAPESRRKSAKTEKKRISTYFAKLYRCPRMSTVQTNNAVEQYVGSQKMFAELCPGPDSRSGGFLV